MWRNIIFKRDEGERLEKESDIYREEWVDVPKEADALRGTVMQRS